MLIFSYFDTSIIFLFVEIEHILHVNRRPTYLIQNAFVSRMKMKTYLPDVAKSSAELLNR